jgi:hypothetical protein
MIGGAYAQPGCDPEDCHETVSQQPEAANAFVKFTTDPANAALLRKGSMELPES